MRRIFQHIILLVLSILLFSGCEEFFDPQQGLVVKTDEFYIDWSEYRSAEMGLYYLQQQLVDQLVIL